MISIEEAIMSVPEKYTRFKDASWFNTIIDQEVLLCGVGGIGSWTALALVSAGCENLTMVDFDTVEEVNLAGQFFKKTQIGKSKVSAAYDNIIDFTNNVVVTSTVAITEDSAITFDHVITGFDKMLPREITFNKWCKHVDNNYTTLEDKRRCIFIDGRLTAEQIQIFTIKGDDEVAKKEYLSKHILPDSEIEDAPCTFKQTRFLAMKIAGIITEIYTNHLTNISTSEYGKMSVPFFFETYTPLMLTRKILRVEE